MYEKHSIKTTICNENKKIICLVDVIKMQRRKPTVIVRFRFANECMSERAHKIAMLTRNGFSSIIELCDCVRYILFSYTNSTTLLDLYEQATGYCRQQNPLLMHAFAATKI